MNFSGAGECFSYVPRLTQCNNIKVIIQEIRNIFIVRFFILSFFLLYAQNENGWWYKKEREEKTRFDIFSRLFAFLNFFLLSFDRNVLHLFISLFVCIQAEFDTDDYCSWSKLDRTSSVCGDFHHLYFHLEGCFIYCC